MAISVIQRKAAADSSGAAGSVSLALTSNTTAGSAIVVCVVVGDSSAVLFNKEARPPTDTQGNKYYYLFSNNWYSSAGYGMRWYAAYNVGAAANTITVIDNSNDAQAVAYEVAGLAAYAAFDVAAFTNHASGGGTTFTSGATAATAFNNEIALGGFMVTNGVTTFTAGGSYTNIQNISGGSRTATEELILSSTGAQTATATASADGFGIGSVITLADTKAVNNVVTITNAGTTFNTNTGTHTVVATPAVNDLIVIVWANSGFTTDPTITDNNSDGNGAYTKIVTALKNTSADNMGIAIRNSLVGSGTSTTFSVTGASSTGGGLTVYRVSGMTKTGATAALQSASQANQAANGTPAPAFTNNITSPNSVIGGVFNGSGATANTHPPIGFAQGNLTAYISPAAALETIFSEGGASGKTITWDAQSPTAFSSVVVELDTSGSTPAFIAPRPQPILQAVNRASTY